MTSLRIILITWLCKLLLLLLLLCTLVISAGDFCNYCAFDDKSIKLCTVVHHNVL